MKVYNTIIQLRKLSNRPISYTEIASVSGLKKIEVIEILANNKKWLILDKQGRVKEITFEQHYRDLYNSGKLYRISPINYGADSALCCVGNDDLQTDYWEGGFGDCRKAKAILNTPENIKELESRGLVHAKQYKISVDKLWKE